MELKGSRLLPVGREAAWAALNDPQRLQAAIPGCRSIERAGDNAYEAVVGAAVGPVRATFRGRLTLADLEPPERYTIHFEGQGGAAGFARGSARVELVPEGRATRMDYTASAQVGGRIAQIGQRLIDAAAAKLADDFFSAFTAQLQDAPEPPEAPAPGAPPGTSRAPLWLAAGLLAAMVAVALGLR